MKLHAVGMDVPFDIPCRLSATERAERAGAWRSVFALVIGHERTAGCLRISFEPHARHDIEALVSAERSCCGWATWSVKATANRVEVEVFGPPADVDALAETLGV